MIGRYFVNADFVLQCMNILGCAHQFCDECMSTMPGADGPFRDAVRWYYNCYLCNKRTSEAKLIRTDPYGRRLVSFLVGALSFISKFQGNNAPHSISVLNLMFMLIFHETFRACAANFESWAGCFISHFVLYNYYVFYYNSFMIIIEPSKFETRNMISATDNREYVYMFIIITFLREVD